MKTGYRFSLLLVITLFLISGCASKGAKRLPADQFDYNAAIGTSAREQMLLNIVRSRYQEMPVFLEVGSVVAQYSYIQSAEAGWFREFINNSIAPTSDTVTANVNLGYSEFPTITYIPLTGEAFAKHLYSPVPADIFFAGAHAGWAVDLLMRIGVQRIGASENMPFGEVSVKKSHASDFKKLERFARTIDLFYILSDAEIIEMQFIKTKTETEPETNDITAETEHKAERYLLIADVVPADMRPLVAEFRQLLRLSNANRFRITKRSAYVGKDEIIVKTRSVMAMIKFLGKGIEIPAEHFEQGRVVDFGLQTNEAETERLFPFMMRSSRNRPNNAFAAVRYEDYWFYIEHQDIVSKRVLEHLMVLFQIKAPISESAGPLLTIPTR